jgi:hypothetical protein
MLPARTLARLRKVSPALIRPSRLPIIIAAKPVRKHRPALPLLPALILRPSLTLRPSLLGPGLFLVVTHPCGFQRPHAIGQASPLAILRLPKRRRHEHRTKHEPIKQAELTTSHDRILAIRGEILPTAC